jgi:hypothetical protein
MHIPLHLNMKSLIGHGGNSCVFADSTGQWVFKLFKSSKHTDFRNDPMPDWMLHQLYASELEAYTLVSKHPDLVAHVPSFGGPMSVASVTNTAGGDITSMFLADCCLKLGRIEGQEAKLNSLVDQHVHLSEFSNRLRQVDVLFDRDASVFEPSDPSKFVVFDFRTREILDQAI